LLINISFTFDVTSAGSLAGKQLDLWVQDSVTWPTPRPFRGHFMVRTQ